MSDDDAFYIPVFVCDKYAIIKKLNLLSWLILYTCKDETKNEGYKKAFIN